MEFQPYVLYQEDPLPPRGTHLWGEFLPCREPGGAESQEEGMRRTFESLRRSYTSCVLVLDGVVPAPYAPTVRATVRSRFALDQHNGRWVEGGPWEVHLIQASGLAPFDIFDLIETDDGGRGVAAVLSTEPGHLDHVLGALRGATDLGQLQSTLLASSASFFGMDHEAFFSFETLDADVAATARAAGRPAEPVVETPPPDRPAIPL